MERVDSCRDEINTGQEDEVNTGQENEVNTGQEDEVNTGQEAGSTWSLMILADVWRVSEPVKQTDIVVDLQ